jgi:hypothetical protein
MELPLLATGLVKKDWLVIHVTLKVPELGIHTNYVIDLKT